MVSAPRARPHGTDKHPCPYGRKTDHRNSDNRNADSRNANRPHPRPTGETAADRPRLPSP